MGPSYVLQLLWGPTLCTQDGPYMCAFTLCADKETLFLALSSCFDDNTFKKSKSALWAAVGETLTKKGLSLVRRRDSDKRSQSRADFEDVWAAFEALDGDDELPAIYCEATDLISLPSPCSTWSSGSRPATGVIR